MLAKDAAIQQYLKKYDIKGSKRIKRKVGAEYLKGREDGSKVNVNRNALH